MRSFVAQVNGSIVDKLLAAKALIVSGEEAYFVHHLHHDFLAARVLARDRSTWNVDSLNVVTLDAASFDGLSMALEQLPSVAEADAFFALAYDWNIYGAAYAVTEGRQGESASLSLSPEMACVILAMLAVRRFDLIESTRVRSQDALSLFPQDASGPFLAAESRRAIGELVLQLASDDKHFLAWRELFLTAGDRNWNEGDLARLSSADPIQGWTLANAVRNSMLAKDVEELLVSMLCDCENSTVRWRIVHVLGCAHRPSALKALSWHLVHDESSWVRFGSARSLIEIAIRNEDIRDTIFNRLRKQVPKLQTDRWTVNEIKACLFVARDAAPKKWLDTVTPLVQEFFVRESDSNKKAEWRSIFQRLENAYGRASSNG